MSDNPDTGQYPNMPPVPHELRFIERHIGAGKNIRILQQYQWCTSQSAFDWYDIPLQETGNAT